MYPPVDKEVYRLTLPCHITNVHWYLTLSKKASEKAAEIEPIYNVANNETICQWNSSQNRDMKGIKISEELLHQFQVQEVEFVVAKWLHKSKLRAILK